MQVPPLHHEQAPCHRSPSKFWEQDPPPVIGNDSIAIYYDKIIPTATYIENQAIKPDLVILNRTIQSELIIEVSFRNDPGLNRAERAKVTKYQQLKYEIRRNWPFREAEVVPVVVGATGLVKKNLHRYLEMIPGTPKLQKVQHSALRGAVAIIKRALGSSLL